MTTMATLKQHEVPAKAVLTRQSKQHMNNKTYSEATDDHRSRIPHSNTVLKDKQKLLELFSVTEIIVKTESKGILHFDSDLNLVT